MAEASSLRLLHVNVAAGYGGGEHQTWLLLEELERLGVVSHALVRRGGRLAARLEALLPPGRLTRLPGAALSLALAPAAALLTRRLGITHLHAHCGRATLAFALAGGARRVAHRRIPDLPGASGRRRLWRADAVLCVSDEIRRRLEAAGLAGPRLETVHSAVEELDRATIAPVALTGSPRLGWLGQYRRHKGLDLLLRALPAALAVQPGLVLHLVGEGEEEPALRRLAADLGLGGAVRFHPFTARPLDWLAALDLFVMPSREEGLGSVALQAQALGIPVLATSAGGIPEGVAHGRTGWLVARESVPALEEGLLLLAGDMELRHRLGAAGPAWVAEHFSVAAMARRTLEIDLELMRKLRG